MCSGNGVSHTHLLPFFPLSKSPFRGDEHQEENGRSREALLRVWEREESLELEGAVAILLLLLLLTFPVLPPPLVPPLPLLPCTSHDCPLVPSWSSSSWWLSLRCRTVFNLSITYKRQRYGGEMPDGDVDSDDGGGGVRCLVKIYDLFCLFCFFAS